MLCPKKVNRSSSMQRLLTCFILTVFALTGCASFRNSHDHCVLIEKSPGKLLLAITKPQWGGVFGPHGYVGYETIGYWAALEGSGPVFVNPHFQDNPSRFHCIGTITLDREHNRVTVNMRRMVSDIGKAERTKPHPANGTYTIESVRKARHDENWF